jgi:hypothetical protein
MKRSIILITFFLLTSKLYQAQKHDYLSLRFGIIGYNQSGRGFVTNYSKVIKDRLMFNLSIGYISVDPITNIHWYFNSSVFTPERIQLNDLIPIGLGLKYFFGNKDFNPYLTVNWGINWRNLSRFKPNKTILNSNEVGYYTNDLNGWDSYSSLGFEMGALYKLTENFYIDGNLDVIYGDPKQIILFSTGLAYNF